MRVGVALTLLCAGAGCAVGRRAVADTAEQPPGGAVSGTAVPGGRDGSAPEPRVLATANDVDALFSLFVAGTTVYYTGGRAVPVSADAAPGSDVSGIVRSISRDGQSPADLWSGQGYALAIAVTGDSAYFLTDDYGSEGRAGQLHRLSLTDGSASVVRGWSAQGSSVGIAGQGTFVAWSYTSGSGGEVLSTTGADTTLVSDSTDPARGQIAVSSAGQVFWLSTPKSLFSASPAGALQSWTLGADVRALALNDKGDRVSVATNTRSPLSLSARARTSAPRVQDCNAPAGEAEKSDFGVDNQKTWPAELTAIWPRAGSVESDTSVVSAPVVE